MKAVIYHADSRYADGTTESYEPFFKRFTRNAHNFGMKVVHLTLEGFPGWGDENYYYPGLNPLHVVANREEVFCDYLGNADDVCWFTETDCVIHQMWPALQADCAMLYRPDDDVPMTPSWRMATPKAVPFFKALREAMRDDPRKDWHGDSAAFTKVWTEMGGPKEHVNYRGVNIEFREYADYVKPRGIYSLHYLGPSGKKKLRSMA